MKKYIVDTNIINWLVDQKIDQSALPADGIFATTHIQIDELNRTSNEERRARLIHVATSVIRELLPIETTVWDISRLDHCKLGDGVVFSLIKSDLDALNQSKANNTHHALIAEVAIVNGFTLLTADKDLADVCKCHGGLVQQF